MTVPDFEVDPEVLRRCVTRLDGAAARFADGALAASAPPVTPDAGQSTTDLAEALAVLMIATAAVSDALTTSAFNLDATQRDYVTVDEVNEQAFLPDKEVR
jgi:hypothetical protein